MTVPVRTNPTIYIAEDNPILLQGLSRALDAHGYAVRAAPDGSALIGMLGDDGAAPDLLLLDLMMPGMGGIDVLSAVRRDSRWSDLPVILITAATREELVGTEADSGSVEVLLKPFRLQELLDRVSEHLRGSGGAAASAG